jgi:hypothetical protein
MTNTTYLEAKRLSLYTLKLSSRQNKTQTNINDQKAFLDILKDDVIEKTKSYQKLYDITKQKNENIHEALVQLAQFLETQEKRLEETQNLYNALLETLKDFDQETNDKYAHILETLKTRANTYMVNADALKERMDAIQKRLEEDTRLTKLKAILMNYINISSNLDNYLREHKDYLDAKQKAIDLFDNHHEDWFTKGRQLIKQTNNFKINVTNTSNSINSIFLTVARQPSAQLSEDRIDAELAALDALEAGDNLPDKPVTEEPVKKEPIKEEAEEIVVLEEPEAIVASTLAQLETNDQKSDTLESDNKPKKKGFFGRIFN